MNLTTLISKLEKQVRIAEKIAARYQTRAEALRGKLDKVAHLLSGKALEKIAKVAQTAPKTKGKRRGMSAAGRARIAEAQRQRWAKIRAKTGGKKATSLPGEKTAEKIVKDAPKKKGRGRGMSAAGRARIAEAQRQRWAKIRAKKTLVKPAAAKRSRRRGHLSAAGRAAIIAGQRRRWAAKSKKAS